MALTTHEDTIEDVAHRFMTAQSAPTPADIDRRKLVQTEIQAKVVDAAQTMADHIQGGRELSTALTKLEEALMWAGKAIFK